MSSSYLDMISCDVRWTQTHLPCSYLFPKFVSNVLFSIIFFFFFPKAVLLKDDGVGFAQEEQLILRLRPDFPVFDWVDIVSTRATILSPIISAIWELHRVVGFSEVWMVSSNLAAARGWCALLLDYCSDSVVVLNVVLPVLNGEVSQVPRASSSSKDPWEMRNEKILRHFSPVEPLPPLLLLAGGPKLSSSETCPGCLPLLWLLESSALPPSPFLPFICCVPSVLRPTTPLTSKTKRTTWRTQELCKRALCHEANRSPRKARRAEGAKKMANQQRGKNKSAHKWRYPHIASATQKIQMQRTVKNFQQCPHWQRHSCVTSSWYSSDVAPYSQDAGISDLELLVRLPSSGGGGGPISASVFFHPVRCFFSFPVS